MKQFRKRVESVMQADNPGSGDRMLAGLLCGASRLYGGAVKLRHACYSTGIIRARRLPCRVISVGNITTGGTGKTPMTVYMAEQLCRMGYRPAVLSRGYKGGAENNGAVVSDGYNLCADSQTAGDEPLLMACRLRGVPVLVGGNRYKSGMRAMTEFDPDIIVLDDGFQHLRLHRDLDLALIDAKRGIGNGYLLPRGGLREPVSGLRRADAVVLTRSRNTPEGGGAALPCLPEVPVFRADHVPYVAGIYSGNDHVPLSVSSLGESDEFSFMHGQSVFAFSGIAQNTEFRDLLEERIGALAGFSAFADHYSYMDSDLRDIVKTAQNCSAELLATTEKDFVRIAGRLPGSFPVAVIGVRMAFIGRQEEEKFVRFVRGRLTGGVSETLI
ncbi:MAG: tetraacyldisaccharide 4'-kinase [Desulfobacteraceae bacterium]|nr:tetraacyldisaccharide 4'-kinase [Desulfobacteraceae bacterium]